METEIRNLQYRDNNFERGELMKKISQNRDFLEHHLHNKGLFRHESRHIWEVVCGWYINQASNPLIWRGDRGPVKLSNTPETVGKCAWPGCKIVKDLQADHIIPKSVLAQTDFDSLGGSDWRHNGQWLCRFHNLMKTDSIMLGLVFLCFK